MTAGKCSLDNLGILLPLPPGCLLDKHFEPLAPKAIIEILDLSRTPPADLQLVGSVQILSARIHRCISHTVHINQKPNCSHCTSHSQMAWEEQGEG